MKRLKEKRIDILIIFFVIAILMWAFLEFRFTLNGTFEYAITRVVSETAFLDENSDLSALKRCYIDLQDIALRTGQGRLTPEEALGNRPVNAAGDTFVRMEYIGVDGISLSPEAKNYSQKEFFDKVMKGQTNVSAEKEGAKQLTVLSVPIPQGDNVIGVLRGYYYFPQLNTLVDYQYKDITKAISAFSLKFLLIFFILIEYISYLLKKKTQLVEDQRGQLDTLTSNIPGGVQCCSNNEALSIQSLSDGFFSMTGFTREEISINFNDQYIKMIHPVDRELVREQLSQSAGDIYEIQYRLLHKNGSTLWILDKGQIIFDRSGGSKLYSVLLDVSDLKRTEKELEQKRRELEISNQKYCALINQTGCVIYDFDPPERLITFNGSFKRVFGYNPPRENFPECFADDDLIHPEDAARFLCFYRTLLEGDTDTREESFRILRSGHGYVDCRIWASTIFDEKHTSSRIVGRFTPEADEGDPEDCH